MIEDERLLFVKQLRSEPRLKSLSPLIHCAFTHRSRGAGRSTNEKRFLFRLVMVLHPTLHRRAIGSQSRVPFR
jgi:hypothetical protein